MKRLLLVVSVAGAAACGYPQLPGAGDGGTTDGSSTAPGSLPFGLELLAGDIGGSGNLDGTGPAARFSGPVAAATDASGNLYVVDGNVIRKIAPGGSVTTLAGAAIDGSSDGAARDARFSFPSGIAVVGETIYVADTLNDTIRKITADGTVSTLAGMAGMTSTSLALDGTGSDARFTEPAGIAVGSDGNLYVADSFDDLIRKVTPGGVVTTLAGSLGSPGSIDATGNAAQFNQPAGIAADSAGNLYVTDAQSTIRKVTLGGVVTTLAGVAGTTGIQNGTGSAALFDVPRGIAVDGVGNVYVADSINNIIRRITPAGVVTTLAGTGPSPGAGDGTGAAASFSTPWGLAIDGQGTLYVTDFNNDSIRKIAPGGGVTTFAGLPARSGSTDGLGPAARFLAPQGITADAAGNIYVSDSLNCTIRKIAPDGTVSTVAGSAHQLGTADGTGADARFSIPSGVAVGNDGSLYAADTDNGTIRRIAPGNVVTTLAGAPAMGGNVDATGTAARFTIPYSIAADGAGNLYVGDVGSYTIRKIAPGAVVTTLAGTDHINGSADGIGAAARFQAPRGLSVDRDGNVYIADAVSATIRKLTPDGKVTTIAGMAAMPGSVDATGASARFGGAFAVAVDNATGNLFVADTGNATIRKIAPGGTVTTVAGTPGAVGIVLGASPGFAFPIGLTIVGDSLVISDTEAILLLRHGAR